MPDLADLRREDLDELVACTPVVLFELDAEGRYTRCQGRALARIGLADGELVGRSALELYGDHPDIGPAVRRALAGETVRAVVRFAGRVFDVTHTPVAGGDGRVERVVAVAHDITERLEGEARLRESEGRFRSLVENLRGIIFCRGEAGGGAHGYGQGGAELYGADVDRLAGTRDPGGRALIDRWYDAVHPEDRPAYLAAERRRKERLEPYSLEYRIAHPATGEPRWMREVAWVVRDEEAGRTYLDSYIVDITDRKRAEAALRASEARHRAIVQDQAELVCRFLPDATLTFANDAYCRYFGKGEAELVGRSFLGLVPTEERAAVLARLTSLRAGEAVTYEHRVLRPDGAVAWQEWTDRAIGGADGAVVEYQAVGRDVTARKLAEARVRYLAHHDALTGLPNRVLFQDRLQQALAQARQHGDRVAVLLLDLDRFKDVNDSLGHEAGDALLREAARRLQGCAREGDTVARLGGDEFVVVVPRVAERRDAAEVARKIVAALAELAAAQAGGDTARGGGASVGVTLYPDDGEEAGQLLRNADIALYRAKAEGRGTYCFFLPDMRLQVERRKTLEAELRLAVARDEFALHYQPTVRLDDGRVVGFEALLRWRHPARGLLGPAEFLTAAEEAGLAAPIGELVLRRAVAQVRAWRAAGLRPGWVAVNLAAAQLERGGLAALARAVLAEVGLSPRRLAVEVTEGVFLGRGAERVAAELEALHGMGVAIALDDFGTGYASLAHLRRFPIDRLKVDRSFVRDMLEDPGDAAIVRAVVNLGHSLGMRVIAEGVETVAQRDWLRVQGCDYAQGSLFGAPLPAEAASALLRRALAGRSGADLL